MSGAYSTTLRAHLAELDPMSDKYAVSVTLGYTRADPYAVTALISSPGQTPVPWTFARDLLRAGLHGPAGLGEVIIGPDDTGLTVIELRSEHGRALIWLDAADVTRFLDRTERIVATGAERIDLDKVARDLLRGVR